MSIINDFCHFFCQIGLHPFREENVDELRCRICHKKIDWDDVWGFWQG